MDGQGLAHQAGDLRAANTVLLGAVSNKLDIGEENWMQALEKMVPEKVLELNKQAFSMGRALRCKEQV